MEFQQDDLNTINIFKKIQGTNEGANKLADTKWIT